jgi:hypothetical protein
VVLQIEEILRNRLGTMQIFDDNAIAVAARKVSCQRWLLLLFLCALLMTLRAELDFNKREISMRAHTTVQQAIAYGCTTTALLYVYALLLFW